jgi:hypothetical protein
VSGNQLEEWVALVAQLPTLVDGQWLEAEVERVAADVVADTSGGRRARRLRHPLGELTYQVREELTMWGRPEFRPTVNLARLGVLAFAIRVLRDADVDGLDDRLARLTTSSADDFESTRFELDVAALHVMSRRKVRFVREKPEQRTPDLEVDGALEVECKRKVELSQRDLAMRDTWAFLERRLYDTLPSAGGYRVELWTRAAPTRTDVDWALAEVKRCLRERAEVVDVTVADSSAGRDLRFCSLEVISDGGGVKVNEPPGARPLEDFDVGKVEITARVTDRALRPQLALQFGFRTDDRKDWIEGVRRSLRNARGQLSGDKPAVVFVEVPAAARASKEGRLGPLKDVVHEAFRNSTRLSGVAIAFTGWLEDEAGNGQAVAEYHVERNPSARHSLATNFYVSGETREMWRRTTRRNELCPCGSGLKFKKCCHS